MVSYYRAFAPKSEAVNYMDYRATLKGIPPQSAWAGCRSNTAIRAKYLRFCLSGRGWGYIIGVWSDQCCHTSAWLSLIYLTISVSCLVKTFSAIVLYSYCALHEVSQQLASYPGSWWVERERAWYLLFAHARNYLLLNTCSDKSGRGTRNTYLHDW